MYRGPGSAGRCANLTKTLGSASRRATSSDKARRAEHVHPQAVVVVLPRCSGRRFKCWCWSWQQQQQQQQQPAPDASRPRKLHGTAAPHRQRPRREHSGRRWKNGNASNSREITLPNARCQRLRASDFGATQRRRSCAYNSDDSSPTREGILASRHACSPFPVSASSYSLITNNVRPCAPAKQWSWAFGRAKNLRTRPLSTCQ